LIYCAGGNQHLARIAVNAGYLYGARLPDTIYIDDLYFADQDFENPNRALYMAYLARHQPVMASVLDLDDAGLFDTVLSWAAEAAQHVQQVMIIPKVSGIIDRLPHTIDGARVILGYSVPTRYGAPTVPLEEFAAWPVHLLGGSPHAQMRLYLRLAPTADVVSADGNMMQLMAVRWCQFWVPHTATHARNHWWPTLREVNDGENWHGDRPAYQEAFARSCVNIRAAWHRISEGDIAWLLT
jgi:hypothetical protein